MTSPDVIDVVESVIVTGSVSPFEKGITASIGAVVKRYNQFIRFSNSLIVL